MMWCYRSVEDREWSVQTGWIFGWLCWLRFVDIIVAVDSIDELYRRCLGGRSCVFGTGASD